MLIFIQLKENETIYIFFIYPGFSLVLLSLSCTGHASASMMDNNQVPLGAIQRVLGHENRSTTEMYLHSLGNTEIDAMMVLERARRFSHTESHAQ